MRCSTRDVAVTLAIPLLDDWNLLPVLQELLDAFVREGMLQQLVENLCRHGTDIRAKESGLHDVNRIPYGRDQDFGLEFVVVEDGHDRLDELHPVFADVVETPDERTHEIRPCLGSHDSLRSGEHERNVHANVFIAQNLRRFEPFFRHGAFHDDIRMQFCEMTAFLNHSCGVTAYGLCTDGTLHDRADLQ